MVRVHAGKRFRQFADEGTLGVEDQGCQAGLLVMEYWAVDYRDALFCLAAARKPN